MQSPVGQCEVCGVEVKEDTCCCANFDEDFNYVEATCIGCCSNHRVVMPSRGNIERMDCDQ